VHFIGKGTVQLLPTGSLHGPSPTGLCKQGSQAMEIKKVKPRILLDFDVLIGADLTVDAQIPGIGLELTHLPVGGNLALSVRKASYFMTRTYAERIRDLLTKALNEAEGETVH
jgi:hypothetical protein